MISCSSPCAVSAANDLSSPRLGDMSISKEKSNLGKIK